MNIEFSYGLLEQAMGKGLMTEVLRLAIQRIQAAKDTHQDITFVEYDGCSPEKHALLTAQKIGEVYASVMDISNYPSLSCCIKAGGKVAGLKGGGSIKVNFLHQEPTFHFSEALTLDLMKYSKTLCQLGFDDSYRPNPPSADEKYQASEASKIFIQQVPDAESRSTILFFIKNHAPEFFVDEPAQRDTACDLASSPEVFSASAGSVEDSAGGNMPLIAEHATPDADVLV